MLSLRRGYIRCEEPKLRDFLKPVKIKGNNEC